MDRIDREEAGWLVALAWLSALEETARDFHGTRPKVFSERAYEHSVQYYLHLLADEYGFSIPKSDSIRKAVEAYPKDTKVVIFGTGGMSHQIHGERSGLINKEWDTAFLNDLTANPARLVNLTHVDYIRDAGAEGIELIVWLIMRGALQDNAQETYRHYHVPASNTAAGLIVLENR